jgi:hypothetical protein
MRYAMLAAVVVLGTFSIPALGQEAADGAEARAKVRSACAADLEKFCQGVERGKGGGTRACFAAHEAELSAECKAARTERAAIRARERG